MYVIINVIIAFWLMIPSVSHAIRSHENKTGLNTTISFLLCYKFNFKNQQKFTLKRAYYCTVTFS